MANLIPFAALRPKPDLAERICELPYDVMSSDEARALASGNPLSFLHVSKPEIDLDPQTDMYSPAVYEQGRENFQRLISQGALVQDPAPCFYLYRQVMGDHSQTGLVAAASCQEYLQNIIRKHELTRPDKEDDRVRHIEVLNSQTGPVFLVYPAQQRMDALVAQLTSSKPAIDFVAQDGIRHTSWVISDISAIHDIKAIFSELPALYIADGHHRSAAAARVFQACSGQGHSAHFLTVIFPHNQVNILPYNRVLKDLNGLELAGLIERLKNVFEVSSPGAPRPAQNHEIGLYFDAQWHTLKFRPELTSTGSAIDLLDVSLLQNHVLEPFFGIDNPRTSKRINFVGGIRGTNELEKLVNSGEYACAFSMYPTSIQELMTIADLDGIMPPKSTWFEPKLRDAMFCHML